MQSGAEFIASHAIHMLAFMAFFMLGLFTFTFIPGVGQSDKHLITASLVFGVVGALGVGYLGF